MTPQIIVPHNIGGSNKDIAAANKRLAESKSYKDLSTVIVCPTRGGRSLCPMFVSAIIGLMRPMNQQVVGPIFMSGMEVGHAFNSAVEMILAHPQLSKFKYMMTIEDDNIPPPDGLLNLYKGIEDYDVVGGLYWTKGEAGQPMIYGDSNNPNINFIPQQPVENTLQRCNGLGMGFNLFRMSCFKKVEKPWFETKQSYNPNEGSKNYTQDLYFYERLIKAGGKVACDTRIRVGHYDIEGEQLW